MRVVHSRSASASSLIVAEVKADAEAARTAILQEAEQLKIVQSHLLETSKQGREHGHELETQARDHEQEGAMKRADIALAATKESATPNGSQS